MTYRGEAMGGFIGNHLTVAALEALRPAADNVGRIATVGTPGQTAQYYGSMGNGWAPLLAGALDPLTGKTTGLALPEGGISGLNQVLNYNPQNYPKTRKLVANIRAGLITSLPVLCVGDSTTEGYNGAYTNCVSNSWVRRLADYLTISGIKAGWQNVMGDHMSNTQGQVISTIDTRVSALAGGWATLAGTLVPSLGGNNFYNVTNTNAFTFTPSVQTDTLDLYYYDASGYDTINIKTGAGGITTPTTGGTVIPGSSNSIKKATATYTLGSNVWTVQKANASAATLIVAGMVAYNSATPEIQLLNCGNGSQKTSYFLGTSAYYDTLNVITTNSPFSSPLAVINLGINDWNSGTTPVATFQTQLSTLVAAYQAAGIECLLVVPVPSNSAAASVASQQAFQAAVATVAQTYGCAYIDMFRRWGSYAQSQPAGFMSDNLHPTSVGYSDASMAIGQFFLTL
jgi:lysophospholipase L1-like esterase